MMPEPEKIDGKTIPCFRCGVCCSQYIISLTQEDAERVVDYLGITWDEWLEEYVEPDWFEINRFMLLQRNGECPFLRHETDRITTCAIQPVKPSACWEWTQGLNRPDCPEGLNKYWGLRVTPAGKIEGPEEKLKEFYRFLGSLEP